MARRASNPSRPPKFDRLTKTLHSSLHATFTELIREARLEAGLSQVQAAERLGIRQNLISDIERGERRVDVVEFITICQAYSISASSFLRKLQLIKENQATSKQSA